MRQAHRLLEGVLRPERPRPPGVLAGDRGREGRCAAFAFAQSAIHLCAPVDDIVEGGFGQHVPALALGRRGLAGRGACLHLDGHRAGPPACPKVPAERRRHAEDPREGAAQGRRVDRLQHRPLGRPQCPERSDVHRQVHPGASLLGPLGLVVGQDLAIVTEFRRHEGVHRLFRRRQDLAEADLGGLLPACLRWQRRRQFLRCRLLHRRQINVGVELVFVHREETVLPDLPPHRLHRVRWEGGLLTSPGRLVCRPSRSGPRRANPAPAACGTHSQALAGATAVPRVAG
mmetsp:Transcript_31775/g.92838  ORF Transcript_31775/g.92838 Transcript_31775/m.92838 type:complete len:287 (-) Transcript_31775:144-1004(-)